MNCPNCKQNTKKLKLEPIGTPKGIYDEPVSQSKTMDDKPVFLKAFRIELKNTKTGSIAMMCIPREEQSSDEPPIIPVMFHVCEPIFVNPCSCDSCYQVLREIGKKQA